MEKKGNTDKNLSIPVASAKGMEAFLKGPFIKGIGPVYAKKIVDRYGTEILDCDFDFENRLKEIPGLGESKITELVSSLKELRIPATMLAFLYSSGLTDSEIEKIASHYGRKVEEVILSDPYDMVEKIWRFSFFTADKIGKQLGIGTENPGRLRGALLTSVKFYAEKGNLFAKINEAVKTASKLTGVSIEKIMPEIESLVGEGRLERSGDALYLPVYFQAEKEAAEKLARMISTDSKLEDSFMLPTTDLEGHPLNPDQSKAIAAVMNNPVTVITGGPGTGKTTTIRGIIELFENVGKKAILTAPTGRAAKRMSVLTGGEAKTIHRLLGYTQGKGYRNKSFDADILVIDEASMLEQVLFNHLLQAIEDNIKIVLVGDTDQLPSIGAGDVLRDLIDSGKVPVIELKDNFRQKNGSMIAGNALAIKHGKLPTETPDSDFMMIEEESPEAVRERLFSLISEELPASKGIEPKDIQVVTPMQEGNLGAKQMNIEIRDRVNPSGPELKRGLKKFRLGDRVMQTLNSSVRGVYNGETGWVSNIDTQENKLEVTFNDGKKSVYYPKDFKELSLAYATSVHKLQGSETDYMVMILTSSHRQMLYRNLLYTGVSRAKKLCVLLGERKAIETAVANRDPSKRHSNFKLRLQSRVS